LHPEATIKKFSKIRLEGLLQANRQLEYYNFAAIIVVGYRVNNYQATHFRIWATQRLRASIIKGFTLDVSG